jgi:hypothetical protein
MRKPEGIDWLDVMMKQFNVMSGGFRSVPFPPSRIYVMSNTNLASGLHKEAATDHEAAAEHHRKAAECHDMNKSQEAKSSSKDALAACNTAQKHSEKACASSAK